MKKIHHIAAVALVLAATVSCQDKSKDIQISYYNGVEGLYYLEVEDFDFDAAKLMADESADQSDPVALCSQVRKGGFVARNLDWFQNDQATAVVRVKSGAKYTSLNVCGCSPVLLRGAETIDAKSLNRLPLSFNDGMNDAGLYIGVNVVPYGEMTEGVSDYGSEQGKPGYVKYKAEDAVDPVWYRTNYLGRMVLDNCATVEEAVEFIKTHNWYDSYFHLAHFQLHWLIADAHTNLVFEFIDSKPRFDLMTTSLDTPSYATVMTNFSNVLASKGFPRQNHGAGYERTAAAMAHYAEYTDMKDFCRLLFYSKAYDLKPEDPEFFWSETVGCGPEDNPFTQDELVAWGKGEGREGARWDAYVQMMKEYKANFEDEKLSRPANAISWNSSHSSVWELATGTLTLDIDEMDIWKLQMSVFEQK